MLIEIGERRSIVADQLFADSCRGVPEAFGKVRKSMSVTCRIPKNRLQVNSEGGSWLRRTENVIRAMKLLTRDLES